jgi:hypothetical protein
VFSRCQERAPREFEKYFAAVYQILRPTTVFAVAVLGLIRHSPR